MVEKKTHTNTDYTPPEIPGQSREEFVYVFFLYLFFFSLFSLPLVAPYCEIPRDYLSNIPLGFGVSQHDHFGAITPPPFLTLWRACEVEVLSPPQRRYLSDICKVPHENKAKWVRYPPLRYYLHKALRDMSRYLALGR